MATTETTTTITNSPDGEVTTRIVTRVDHDGASTKTLPAPISAEELAYQASVANLLTGLQVVAPNGQPAGPQLEEGTIQISPNVDVRFQTAIVFVTQNQGTYTENWVATDVRSLDHGSFCMTSINDDAPDFSAEVTALKSTHNGQNGNRDWHDFRTATVTFQFLTPPTQTAIDAMGATPSNHERRIFDIFMMRAGDDPEPAGAMYRDVSPVAGLGWTEHWRMLSNYEVPAGGRYLNNGTVVQLVPRVPDNGTNPTLGFHLFPIEMSVKEFLTDMVNDGGSYCQVTYTWSQLP